jgi:peptide subunit release factor 1 (eRF1)
MLRGKRKERKKMYCPKCGQLMNVWDDWSYGDAVHQFSLCPECGHFEEELKDAESHKEWLRREAARALELWVDRT